MDKSFEDIHRENRLFGHIVKKELPNKEAFLSDLYNISDSFVGQIDTMFLNAFIQECEALIINAIALFEKGYFDCACYSLRQALEVSDCMVYFSELNDSERQKEFSKWKMSEKLEAYKVGNFLNNLAENYKDVKVSFSVYFNKKKRTKARLNTIVHKQGLDVFYSFRRNFTDAQMNNEVAMFTSFLKTVITYVAILRLAVDPFPILLRDEEIYFRLPGLMTEPYSFEFVNKYIGEKYIDEYKKTDLYSGYYNGIVNGYEKKNPAIANLIAHRHIDIDSIDELEEQAHLLGLNDLLALLVAVLSPKISNIYTNEGFTCYHTNTISVRGLNYSTFTIKSYKTDSNNFNQKYDNAFMSFLGPTSVDFLIFGIEDFSVFIEHNLPFEKDEIDLIEAKYSEIIESFQQKIEKMVDTL